MDASPCEVDINRELIFEFPIKSVDMFATPLTESPKVLMEEAVINPELRKTVLRLLKIKELTYPADPRPTTVLVSCVELTYLAVPKPITVDAKRGPLPATVE
jgi:hypothetical protein